MKKFLVDGISLPEKVSLKSIGEVQRVCYDGKNRIIADIQYFHDIAHVSYQHGNLPGELKQEIDAPGFSISVFNPEKIEISEEAKILSLQEIIDEEFSSVIFIYLAWIFAMIIFFLSLI